MARCDAALGYAECVEILGLIESAKQSANTQSKQAEPPRAMGCIKTEPATVQARASAYSEASHVIFVVADEKKCRLSIQFPIFNTDA